jgi:hypothetical protein
MDAPGRHYSEMSMEGVHNKTTTGLTVGLEVISSPIVYKLSFGGGISYQFVRKLDTDDYQGFQFATFYGIVRYKYAQLLGVECSLIGNLGYSGNFGGTGNYGENYSINGSDLSYNLLGGLYYAGGVRFDKDIFFVEAAYKSYGGTASSTTYHFNATIHYQTLSLSLGVLI